MNVFRKISSTSSNNIFQTQKKQQHIKKSRIPQSAQKLTAKQQQCFYLIDYELRCNGLLLCKLSKDQNLMKRIGWRRRGTTQEGIFQCMVKNKQCHQMWIGRQYWFVNIQKLGMQKGQDGDENNGGLKGLLLLDGKFIADKAILVNESKNQQKYQKK